MRDWTPERGCEKAVGWRGPEPICCGRPVRYRYEAMAGGYFHMCEAHGRRHLAISEELTPDGWRHCHAPEPDPIRAPRPVPDRDTGGSLRRLMGERRWTPSDVAKRTGYARGTVVCWLAGWNLSPHARRAIAGLQAQA